MASIRTLRRAPLATGVATESVHENFLHRLPPNKPFSAAFHTLYVYEGGISE